MAKVTTHKQRKEKGAQRATQVGTTSPRGPAEANDEPDILEGLARDIVSRLATTLFGEDDADAWERPPVGDGANAGPVPEVRAVRHPVSRPEDVMGAAREPSPPPGEVSEVDLERVARLPSLRPRPVKSDRPALLVRGTVRSGRQIRHKGDVVVLGDVNPGAQIVAAGDVVVMGTLRGMVHAGATGDHTAVVAAFRLAPTQLRIASYLARPPEEPGERPDYPEVAMVRDGVVVVKPLLSGTFPGLGPAAFRQSRR